VGCCHRGPDGKTAKDVAHIANAKRQYDRAHGTKTKAKAKIPSPPKAPSRAPKMDFTKRRSLFATKEASRAD
jgi:hypothetical protein